MNLFRQLILPLLIGLIGGIVGVLVILQFIPVSQITTATQAVNHGLFEFNEATLNINSARTKLVNFYYVDKTKEFIGKSESVATGVALTADGLIVASSPFKSVAGISALSSKGDFVDVVFARNKDETVFFDQTSNLAFYVASNEDGTKAEFSPSTLLSFEKTYIGQTVFSFDSSGKVLVHRVIQVMGGKDKEKVQSSDSEIHLIKIDNNIETSVPIFNVSGEVVGFSKSGGFVVPAEIIKNMLNRYLKNGEYKPTKLGINFVDLNNMIQTNSTHPTTGLLVKSSNTGLGVVKKSSADKAGIKIGDIIASFDNRRIDGSIPFQILLQRYSSGTEIEIDILRNGEVNHIKAVLE